MLRFLDITKLLLILLVGVSAVPAHATRSHTVHSKQLRGTYYSTHQLEMTQVGTASWYGGRDIGRLTASGERYHRTDVTAAHRRLPFNTRVLVTNLKNGKTVVVRINDRGPFIKERIIDLSLAAARQIDLVQSGIAQVQLQVIDSGWKPIDFYVGDPSDDLFFRTSDLKKQPYRLG